MASSWFLRTMTTCSHRISWKYALYSYVLSVPDLGAFGAGSLEPEFEVQPPSEILPRIRLLALRTVSSARWTKDTQEFGVIPWGAGLCVIRSVANSYRQSVENFDVAIPLDRRGDELFSGGDDLFCGWLPQLVSISAFFQSSASPI